MNSEIVHDEKLTAACGCTGCVNENPVPIYSIYENRIIYFCTEKCKEKFDNEPEKFLNSSHFKIRFEDLRIVK